jgi:hypothetical protein
MYTAGKGEIGHRIGITLICEVRVVFRLSGAILVREEIPGK